MVHFELVKSACEEMGGCTRFSDYHIKGLIEVLSNSMGFAERYSREDIEESVREAVSITFEQYED